MKIALWYDKADDHTPMSDTLEPEQINDLLGSQQDNIIYKDGQAYTVSGWGAPRPDGKRLVMLSPYDESKPF